MKDVLIWCNTKDKVANVIAKLKKDRYSVPDVDYVWKSYGDEAMLRVKTQFKDVTFASRQWYKENGYGDAITADQFLGEKKRPSIVIFRRDRNVIAKNVATGDEGIAKCSPSDEFDFKVGAAIALARLLAKDHNAADNKDVKTEWNKLLGIEDSPVKKYTDADRNFKVGDRVVVREWDDMADEYGAENGIRIKGDRSTSFIANMRHLCGRNATVTGVRDDYVSVAFDNKSGNTDWFYKKWMFNPTDATARDDVIREGDTVKVVNTGLNYTSYVQWVGEHISDPYMAARFCFGSPSMDEKYKVIKIAEHERSHRPLAYIEEIGGLSYNKCYLIEVKGLEKV